MNKIKIYLMILVLLIPLLPSTSVFADTLVTYSPSSILVQTNTTGTVSLLQDDVDTPDANYLTVVDPAVNTSLDVALADPSGALTLGANVQKIRVLVKKNNTLGNNPTAVLSLWDNNGGTKTQIGSNVNLTLTDTPTIMSLSFDANSLVDKTGKNLEVKITGTPAGGGAATKRAVLVGAINFDASVVFGNPSNLRSTHIQSNSVGLAWDVAPGATSYEVKRNGVVVYTGVSPSFIDTTVSPVTNYTYDVRAYNGAQYSSTISANVTTLESDDWVQVTSGGSHTLGIKSDGTLWSWGYNNNGQLGIGTTTNQTTPVQVGIDSDWKSIGGGNGYSLAIKTNGTLWSWGLNTDGQLGLGDVAPRYIPTQVGFDTKWTIIQAGIKHTLAIKNNGTLWSWGENSEGQLGLGDTSPRNTPTQVGVETTWRSVDAGGYFTLATKTDGTLWSWGSNNDGELGLNDTTRRNSPTRIGVGTNWKDVSGGDDHSLATKTDGTLWSWGYNNSGHLGLGDNVNRNIPTQVGMDTNWKQIVGGGAHSMATKTDGSLWSWGFNDSGQLGLGDSVNRNVPVQVGTDVDWKSGSLGNYITFAIKNDGTLWSWGRNTIGQLGLGDSNDRNIPTKVNFILLPPTNFATTHLSTTTIDLEWSPTPSATSYELKRDGDVIYTGNNINYQDSGLLQNTVYSYEIRATDGTIYSGSSTLTVSTLKSKDWMEIAAGTQHSLGIKANGTLWSWGRNNYGELGLGDTTIRNVPTQVGTDTNWKSISAGEAHSLAIKNDGTLWSWGLNNDGQLGQNDTVQRIAPTQVGTDTNYKGVVAGNSHSLALKTDGTLWSWGYNNYGQLGLNDTSIRYIPTKVGTDTNWKSISSGNYHNLAIKTNGTLWSWGSNVSGELGLGNAGLGTERKIPTQVGTGSNWKSVDAGGASSFAIKNTGTLWSWGLNGDGQLGVGDRVLRNIPTQVGVDTNWKTVSSGGSHVIAIKATGSLWSWGDNYYGQLGQNDSTVRTVPFKVGTNMDWYNVSAGVFHSLAIKFNGTLWSWGANINGQLGLDDVTNRLIPMKVSGAPRAAPPNFRYTTLSTTSVRLDWDTVANATSYTVKRNGVVVYTGPGNTFSQSGIAPPDVYDYEVYGSNDEGDGPSAPLKVPVGLQKQVITLTPGSTSNQTLTDDFETPTSPFTYNFPPISWTRTTDDSNEGIHSLTSNIANLDGMQSFFDMTVEGPGNVSFWYKVSSEPGYDKFTFEINGTKLINEVSGEIGWTHVSYPIPAGSHVLMWTYEKDNSERGGLDAVFVDDLMIESQTNGPVQVSLPSGKYYFAEPVSDVSSDPFKLSNDGGTTWGSQTNGLGVFNSLTKGQSYPNLVLEHRSTSSKSFSYYYLSENDTTPPNEVTNLNETHASSTVNLTWTNPINSDFSHVKIYRNGTLVGDNITTPTFSDSGLSSGTSYTYKIHTIDVTGNISVGVTIFVTTTSTGSLSIIAPSDFTDFGDITVDGTIHSLTSPLNPLMVSDLRGSGVGWNVTVESSPFIQINFTAGNTPIILPIYSFSLQGIQGITQTVGSSTLPSVLPGVPWLIDDGPVSILSAGVGEAMGTFEVSFPVNALQLNVDTSNSLIDQLNNPTEFESTITWSVSSGP